MTFENVLLTATVVTTAVLGSAMMFALLFPIYLTLTGQLGS